MHVSLFTEARSIHKGDGKSGKKV